MKTADNCQLVTKWHDHYVLFKGTQEEAISGLHELIDLEVITLTADLGIGIGKKWWVNDHVWLNFTQGKGIGPVI